MINLDWKPSKDSKTPINRQIVDYIISKIENGQWAIGTRIPTQRDLANIFNVNRSTIVSALDELKYDGFLLSNGRGGTIVAETCFNYNDKVQRNWQDYIKEGIHIPNDKIIKMINESEPDKNMLKLCSGEASPEMFSIEKMQIVLSHVSKNITSLGYGLPSGDINLRIEISKYLETIGIKTSPNSILIVSGALQAIQLISIGILQQGSSVFVEKPSYIYSLQILQTLGMRRVGIPIDNDGILCNEINKNIRKNKSSILYTIPNYQNPTGVLMSLERRKELLNVCNNENLPIIEDDVYGELWIDEPPPLSIKALDKVGNSLYVGSVSKTLSPGLRIGWIVGPEEVINRLADIKMQMDYGSSSLAQLTVSKWLELELYQEHLFDMREKLKIRRDYTLKLLDYYFKDLATWEIPKGGYYIWLKLKFPMSTYKLFEEAFKENVLFYPGYLYESRMNNYIRISYSYSTKEEMEKGLKILSSISKVLINSK